MSVAAEVLIGQLAALRLPAGRPALVHASMRRIGSVDGGAGTLLTALRGVLGPGAVVVPAQTPNNSTTSPAFRAATAGLTNAEIKQYVARLSGFDPATTPSYGMGALAETVRRHAAAVRSSHPQTSFAAVGPGSDDLLRVHRLESHLGEDSPLAALYRADATILLIGIGYTACTAFHLAEYRLPGVRRRAYQCFVRSGDQRRQYDFRGVDLDDSDFAQLGADLERSGVTDVRSGLIGQAFCRALSIRDAVDFAVKWLGHHRRLAPSRR